MPLEDYFGTQGGEEGDDLGMGSFAGLELVSESLLGLKLRAFEAQGRFLLTSGFIIPKTYAGIYDF